MNVIRTITLFMLIVLCLAVVAARASEEPLQVMVSIVPQKYFVENIGGKYVKVDTMVEEGVFPHTYEPSPHQMKALTKASMYFTIGVSFEKSWLEKFKAANPGMKIVRLESGIGRIPMDTAVMTVGEHNDKDELHQHEGEPDPHIWLSPALVKHISSVIRDNLIEQDPEHKEYYQQQYDAFIKEIEKIDVSIRGIVSGIKQRSFLVFHPSWGYFARDYNLQQIAVEIEGKEPGPKDLITIIEMARKKNIKAIFVQPQISTRSAKTIARAIEGKVVIADPLAYAWGRNLVSVAEKIKNAEQQ